jgi:hypothetical protein
MSLFAGIDYDTTAVHIVTLEEEGDAPIYSYFPLEGMDAFERAREVHRMLPVRGWWLDAGVIAIGIEEQNSGNPKMRSAVQKLNVIQGAILSCLPRDTLVNPMNAPNWRKTVGLKGNATKHDVRAWALAEISEQWPEHTRCQEWPQDAFDAYCLARAVERLVDV